MQRNYWTCWETQRDPAQRLHKAKKIQRLLEDASPLRLHSARSVLDVGCSIGVILEHLAQAWEVQRAVGVDIDSDALRVARSRSARALYCMADGERLPFPDRSFDLVICAQVYEHVPDWKELMREVHRVLRVGGICFFSGPNRLSIWEDHYQFPFLSWLPRPWAHRFVRWTGRGAQYYEQPVTWWTLRRWLVRLGFHIVDCTPWLLETPERFALQAPALQWARWLIRILPAPLRSWLVAFVPNFNLILIKPSDASLGEPTFQ